MPQRNRGYYRNSLEAWRGDLLERRRLGKVRLDRMNKMNHPDAGDHEMLLAINEQMIDIIQSAQNAEKSIRDLMDEPEATLGAGQ